MRAVRALEGFLSSVSVNDSDVLLKVSLPGKLLVANWAREDFPCKDTMMVGLGSVQIEMELSA